MLRYRAGVGCEFVADSVGPVTELPTMSQDSINLPERGH